MEHLLEIKSDVCDIVKRIKKLNNRYVIYYNLKEKKFMLYIFENNLKSPIYCLTYPFSVIDERMIEHTLKSEIQNRKWILEQMEKSNSLLFAKEQKNIIQQMENMCDSKRNN